MMSVQGKGKDDCTCVIDFSRPARCLDLGSIRRWGRKYFVGNGKR